MRPKTLQLKARRGLKSKCNTTTAQEQLCSNAGLFFFVLPAKSGEGAGRTHHTAAEPQYGARRGESRAWLAFCEAKRKRAPRPADFCGVCRSGGICTIVAAAALREVRKRRKIEKAAGQFYLSFVGLSMILYTIIRKEFNGRKPAQRTHWTMIRLSEMDF